MKRLALVFALVLVLAISAGAQDLGNFAAEVPDGWTANPMPTLSTIIFVKNDNNAMASITVDDAGESTAKQIADYLTSVYKQQGYIDMTTPEEDENGNYIVNMKNQHKLPSRALFSVKGGKACVILLVGLESGKEGFTKILDSFALIEKKNLLETFKISDNLISK
ncbi:MAG: hypothetical protein IJS99_05045 [Synergistaceae bacterium]|nr:hypothetical protein [Synergistaceae bacterium]